MWIPVLLVCACYLLGSLSGSLMLGRLRGVDIRTLGSGNAGGTNALRTQGFKFALGTVLVDVGKGALAAGLALRYLPAESSAVYACVLAAVAGHVWPLFHGFRGGKGAATLVGGLLVIWPMSLVAVLGVWVLSLGWGGYVGLSTVLAGFGLFFYSLMDGASPARMVFAGLAALFLTYTHRSNLARLRAGTEPRFERARFIGRWLPGPRG